MTQQKKKKTENQEKRNKSIGNCLSESLVPIHRDTQIDLKTEKGGVVKGHSKKKKKIENQEKKKLKVKLRQVSIRGYC